MGEIERVETSQGFWVFAIKDVVEFLLQLDPDRRISIHQSVIAGHSHITITIPNTAIMAVNRE